MKQSYQRNKSVQVDKRVLALQENVSYIRRGVATSSLVDIDMSASCVDHQPMGLKNAIQKILARKPIDRRTRDTDVTEQEQTNKIKICVKFI